MHMYFLSAFYNSITFSKWNLFNQRKLLGWVKYKLAHLNILLWLDLHEKEGVQ